MGPLLAWLLAQWVGLMLAAFRVPLCAAYPQPAEFQAVRLMEAVQFATLAILFPSLLRTRSMVLIAAASGWAMLIAAAALNAENIREIGPVALYLGVWLIVLAILRHALPDHPRWIAAALLATYFIGGPLVWYLGTDLGSTRPDVHSLAYGPIANTLSSSEWPPIRSWFLPLGLGGFSIAMIRFSRRSRRQR